MTSTCGRASGSHVPQLYAWAAGFFPGLTSIIAKPKE